LSNVVRLQIPEPDPDSPMAAVRLFLQQNPMVYVSGTGKYWIKTSINGWKPQSASATYLMDPMFIGDGRTANKYRQALQMVLQDDGLIYRECTYSFRNDLPSDTFNLLDQSDWLEPEAGRHHIAFDILLASLCNLDEAAIDHVKRVIAWKRICPQDSYALPCIVFFGEGGTGKNTLMDRVLYTMFARQTVSASAQKVLGKFNKIIQGKTVVMINEAKTEDVDPNALKGLLQQERIPVEPKGIDPFDADNTPLYFIASNRKDGGVWLDRSDADRRISLIGVPKGRTPKLTLPYRIAQVLDLSASDAIKWMTQIGLPTLSDRHEVAKWLGHLLLTCDLSEQPRAYHEGSYVEILERQKPLFERFCEGVFLDKAGAEGKPAPFNYINETTAYRAYIVLCKALNTGHGAMVDQRFRADLKDWIEANAPHIQRKEHWQGYGQQHHVRLWFNTRLSELSLNEANDSSYLIGDPGREVWVGPDI
jgi:hypothetical protein